MALLQIAEPGQSPAPHQRKLAVGIDLGTTNSLVATMRSGEAVTLADAEGRHLLPSIVHYAKASVDIGYDAQRLSVADPMNTIASVKRLMGRGIEDLSLLADELPYQLSTQQSGMPVIHTRIGDVSPVQVSAEILKSLVRRAELSLADELTGAVITVPAYFDDAQRQATKDAAKIAGLNVLRLLNEPTAAAVAYGLDQGAEGVVAVYDLGGGTFDISILRLNKGVFEVLATGGDSALGGDDFDLAIAHWLVDTLSLDVSNPSFNRYVLQQARYAKEALSSQNSVDIDIKFDSIDQQVSLGFDLFSELTKPLVTRTLRACRRALKDAEISIDDVAEVVMVGGSTRMPIIRTAAATLFSREPHVDIDPDRVVALGAAMQADVLVGNKPDSEVLLLDVLPLSLGLETMGGLVEKVIHRNSPIPVARAQEFTTYQDGQTAMSVHIVQGERELVSDCRSLANFVLRGIPPMAAGAAKILVTFQVDADGLLNVSAKELSTGTETNIQVKPSYGLSDAEVTRMLTDSYQSAQLDLDARALREQQVDAERILQSTIAAIAEDGAQLLSIEELSVLTTEIERLKALAQGDDAAAIERGIKQLASASDSFASRRMDQSIRQALQGQNVDDIEEKS